MKRRAFVMALVASPALAGDVVDGDPSTPHPHPHPQPQGWSGTFTSGRTTGSVQLIQHDGIWVVRLGDDFDHEGSPDPWVALGSDGFRRDAQLGPLNSDTGQQDYPLGPRDPAEFNEVWIWCQRFSTPLGRARLTPNDG